jgi:hypothetical protein
MRRKMARLLVLPLGSSDAYGYHDDVARWSYPVQSPKLDDHLAFVRQEARAICDEQLGDVPTFIAAEQVGYTLALTRWTQARYPHFRLREDEFRAIFRFIEGWQASGPQATQEIRTAAAVLRDVGLTPP